jgi:K(+)-stimulated pyrophosphate-energized sodium pump
MISKKVFSAALLVCMVMLLASPVLAGEADIKLPPLDQVQFSVFGGISGLSIMYGGLFICIVGLIFAMIQYKQTHKLPAHKSMLGVSNIIWETCKSYLTQQGKFLIALWVLIAACMVYYFVVLSHTPISDVAVILACSVLGILGSYGVAWFGMRINERRPSACQC